MQPFLNTPRTRELFEANVRHVASRTDRVFGILMAVQYLTIIAWAAYETPLTYSGSKSSIHPHLLAAILLGGGISVPIIALAFLKSGASMNKWFISVGQMLMGALLIHVSGGRIETHFHVFGSLAFLSLYRDWRVLLPATAVVLVDHIARGFLNPMSIYGVPSGAQWRFLEHAAWVVYENIVLIATCVAATREMKAVASRQAELEEINGRIEATIVQRTVELRQAESRYGEVIRHSLDSIILVGRDGKVTEMNPSAEQLFNTRSGEEIGKDFSMLFDGESRDTITSFVLNEARTSGRYHLMATREDTQVFPVEVSLAAANHSDGVAYVAFIRDLTEQRRLESKLSQAQKMESIGQMSTGIAHEINTPNQYIGDNVRFVADCWKPLSDLIKGYQEAPYPDPKIAALEKKADLEFVMEEIPSALNQALEGVSRVESIIRAMKEFAHPGGGQEVGVSLNKIIENACLVSRNEWKYVADLDLDLSPSLPVIQANAGELGQVVVNLVVNAAHAIKDRITDGSMGSIVIRTFEQEGNVVFEVRDNGKGIPIEAQKRIYDPFFTTKGVGIGTGQGLAITHSVVERHNGEIELESEVGVGTTFRIKLPQQSLTVEQAA